MPEEKPSAEPGLGSLLIGYLLLGIQPIPVALLKDHQVGAAETVFARFAFSALVILLICLARRRGLRTERPKVLILRGLFGGSAVLLYFYSIQHAGAARGTLLNYSYPVWANLFAMFLGQKPHARFWPGLFASLVGLWLVVVPDSGLGTRAVGPGEWAGLASAVFAGGAVLTIKELRKTDESLTVIASFTAFGLVMSAPLADWSRVPQVASFDTLWLTLAVGLSAFLGHVFFTRGYRGVSVSHATLLSLCVPVVATFIGIFVLKEEASLRFIFGAALVISSVIFVLRGRSEGQPQFDSKSAT